MTDEKIKQEIRDNFISDQKVDWRLVEFVIKLCKEEFEKDLMKEKCRNCGQLEATETWQVCSVCGDILQDYLVDTYKERQKIIEIIKQKIEELNEIKEDGSTQKDLEIDVGVIKVLQQLLVEIGDKK